MALYEIIQTIPLIYRTFFQVNSKLFKLGSYIFSNITMGSDWLILIYLLLDKTNRNAKMYNLHCTLIVYCILSL